MLLKILFFIFYVCGVSNLVFYAQSTITVISGQCVCRMWMCMTFYSVK